MVRKMQMFADGRSRKVVFLAHCLLNQNAISDGTAVYPAAFRELVQFFLEHQVGIVQLPCPELCCLGLDRGNRQGAQSPVTEENTRIRAASRMLEDLVESVIHQVLEYHRYGFRIVAFLGANRSPNCGVEATSDHNQEMPGRGLFLGALEDRIRAAGLEIPLLGVKASDDLLNLFARLRPLL